MVLDEWLQPHRRRFSAGGNDLGSGRRGLITSEEVVAPNIPGIIHRYFGAEEPDVLLVTPKRNRQYVQLLAGLFSLCVGASRGRTLPRFPRILPTFESSGAVQGIKGVWKQ
jgi:hypothetical protein